MIFVFGCWLMIRFMFGCLFGYVCIQVFLVLLIICVILFSVIGEFCWQVIISWWQFWVLNSWLLVLKVDVCCLFISVFLVWLRLVFWVMLCRLDRVMFIVVRCFGWVWMWMVGCCWLMILILDMLLIWLIECVRWFLVRLFSLVIDICVEIMLSIRIGLLVGLILCQVGRFGRLLGRCLVVVLIVVCIFCVVVLMFFFRLNCSVIEVLLSVLVEVILMMLGMLVSCVFSGVVIVDVMVLVLVLGRLVLMWMVGNFVLGRGVIGNCGNVVMLSSIIVSVSSVVVIGCWMNQLDSEMWVFMVWFWFW